MYKLLTLPLPRPPRFSLGWCLSATPRSVSASCYLSAPTCHLPVLLAVAVYIGMRGSLLMARSLADNFPLAAALLRPLLAALGQSAAGTAAGAAAAEGATAAGP